MPNRRQDTRTRDRYDELKASWDAAVERLDARYRKVVVAVIAMAVTVILLIGFHVILLKRVNDNAAAATSAMCALRGDLERRVAASEQYLVEHQEPEIFGVPRTTIEDATRNQKRTIEALSGLDCD